MWLRFEYNGAINLVSGVLNENERFALLKRLTQTQQDNKNRPEWTWRIENRERPN